ncbi:site-specific integrase [Cronobacter malonaticus]|nr:site-specific integrase [Cronobacter malonaticus]
MSVMATPWKHPKSGVFYFRRQVPADIRNGIGRSEWKVSLKTKELSVARPRFAAESARCEEAFAAAREQLAGRPRVIASDAPKLADHWASTVMDSWERQPESIEDFLVVTDGDTSPASDVVDTDSAKARLATVEPFIRQSLKNHHLPLPDEAEPAHRALVEAFFQRWLQLCQLANRRHRGDWSTPLQLQAAQAPLQAERQQKPEVTAPTLSKVFEAWADDKRLTDGDTRSTQKTINDFSSIINRFIELFGDLPVSQITRVQCQEFRALLGRFPARGKGTRGLSARELIAKAEAENMPTVELTTVRKQLRALSAVLNFAVQRLDVIKEEPISASGMLKGIAKAAKRSATRTAEDKHYTRAELLTIFRSPVFTGQWKPPRADFGQALYWLPLLMLYTGARREELAQMLVSDVIQDEATGIWYLSIQPGDDKSIKTGSSRRKVPLHADLLELGFLDYVRSLSATGRLFPKLQPHPVNGYGHAVGKAWAKYLKEVVKLTTQASPSHGFRHSFKTLCREAGIETAVSDWITGHAPVNVGGSYGSNPLRRMAEELQRFPSIAAEAGLLNKPTVPVEVSPHSDHQIPTEAI